MQDNLTPGEWKALDEPNCITKPRDKGGNVVLWQEQEYLNDVYRQLNDQLYYEGCARNPFPELVDEINYCISRAFKVGLLKKKEYAYLKGE